MRIFFGVVDYQIEYCIEKHAGSCGSVAINPHFCIEFPFSEKFGLPRIQSSFDSRASKFDQHLSTVRDERGEMRTR
jgi:hypothetical protein